MAVVTKDPVKLRAVAIMLAGAGISGAWTESALRGNNSLHVNFWTKVFSPGVYTAGEKYAPRQYIHGWFNLDDPQGAMAFLGAGMDSVFNPPKVQPKTWPIGSRVAAADPGSKRIIIGCNVVSLAVLNDMVATLENKNPSGFAPRVYGTYDFGFETKNNDILFAALMILQGAGYQWSDGTSFFNQGVPGSSTQVMSGYGSKVIHVDAARKIVTGGTYKLTGSSEYPSGYFIIDTQGVQVISKLLSGSATPSKSWKICYENGNYSRTATADFGRKAVSVRDDQDRTLSVPLATLKEMAAALR